MTTPEAGEGPARVFEENGYWRVSIGEITLYQWCDSCAEDECKKRAAEINRALSPLVARASLAERMAEKLEGLVDVLHDLDAVQWEDGPPVNWDELVEMSEELLADWDRVGKGV